ncbi:DNA polymerase I [Fulvivirga sp. 29W222]|uniref:DNA polymerase I n=1 Tax=Fulvivirga marina TaxID=2494733 RepID=A0A937KDJ4_9BACT|nr:DNA polymerase I [Fulvivirga marina]MBL6446298.1 DNA polymerase I [Fulvivirga marina]
MSKPEKKLFLLDAYALIYRAHFAFSKNPRISSKGVNTGVMFGFMNTLLEVLQKQKPTHIAVAFDTSAPTFRHEQFAEYKAHREETPEDIKTGIPVVKDIVRAFNIPVIELDGYEADDIIGTLAKKAGEAGFEVFMMTPDKDFGQLVDEHVYLYKPAYMGNAVDVLGVPEVLEKWNIERVDQVKDMLGLQGDAADNIPGIPGIGPKTAAKLIKEFGSVEELVANVDKLKGKQKENVETYGQQGVLSKELATINTEVPIEFNEKELLYEGPDEEKLKPICEELEFKTIMKRIFGEEASGKTAPLSSGQLSMFSDESKATIDANETVAVEKGSIKSVEHDYHLITSAEKRKELIEFLQKQEEFCFDTETTDIDAVEAEVVGLAFSYVKGEAYYVALAESFEESKAILQEFKPVMENEKVAKIGQNVKYDILVLKKYGIHVKGKIFDTMLAHYVIEPEMPHNMDAIAEQYLNYTCVPITAVLGAKGKQQRNMRDIAPKDIVEYAGEDADITLQLKQVLSEQLKKEEKLVSLLDKVEYPLAYVLSDMEFEGVRIDEGALKQMSAELQEASVQAQEEIFKIAGCEFNIASPKQLGEVLFDRLKLMEKPKKTKSGQYATGEEILSRLAAEHDIARKILEFREYQKLKSTYVDALPKMISASDGRVHTDYGQAVAATGRLSSNNPNLQNIPIRTEKGREIRKAFVPRDENHVLLSADYSQIELRIAASFAQDKDMIEAFKNGRDIHATTAAKVFNVALEDVDPNMRRKAKEVNFGIIYGISAFGLSQNLNIPRSEANDIINAYFKEFSSIKKYMDDSVNKAKEQGYVETIMGRRRYLRDINSRNATMRGYAERNAINAPIQGSAADIIKVAMVNIHQWLKEEKLSTKMILQVHDELIFDVPKAEVEKVKENVIRLMMSAVNLEVPLEVEAGVGENWLKAH